MSLTWEEPQFFQLENHRSGQEVSFYFLFKKCITCTVIGGDKSDLVSWLYGPAHRGGAVEKFHFVIVWGNKKELLWVEKRIPSHAPWHGTLLYTLYAEEEELVALTLFQVILHLLLHTTHTQSYVQVYFIKLKYDQKVIEF